jgi:membrane fusion protein (multidrug efflux system)
MTTVRAVRMAAPALLLVRSILRANMGGDVATPQGPNTERRPPVDGTGGDSAEAADRRHRSHRRRRILVIAAVLVVIAGLAYYLHSRRFEDTDDAQIDANISNIGARVSGTIVRVLVVENQPVKAGDVLAEIDPTDLQVAVAQARAAVAQAEAQLQAENPTVSITQAASAAELSTASSSIASAQAALGGAAKEVDQARARLAEAQASNRNTQLELQRGRQLFNHGAIARSELDRRETAAQEGAAGEEAARQSLAAAQARVEQQRAQMTGIRGRLTEVKSNAPRELAARQAQVLFRQANLDLARAQQRQAELNLSYATVRTPVAGIVVRKSVNLGDHVAPGQQLVAIAQTGEVWVTANFRETQLRRMRPGQRARVHVDALARDFSGSVESLGGATGSRTSILPPENATGNYVKVVQRIPVRIHLDPGQSGLERLRPGMSVEPKVSLEP